MYAPNDDLFPVPEFYTRAAEPSKERAPISDEVVTDVVVIGGGYTGLSAALHLAQRGAKVAVLERHSIGWGASGRNAGQVGPYLKLSPGAAIKVLGEERGQRLLNATGTGPQLVFDLVDRYRIGCDLVRNGLLYAAYSAAGVRGIEARLRYWEDNGTSIQVLDRATAHRLVGSDFYSYVTLEPRGGTINPLGLANGFARAVEEEGGLVFCNSPVVSVSRVSKGWEVSTPTGRVLAGSLVFATNAYTTPLLSSELRASIIPMRAYQLVSKPLSKNVAATILPGGQALTDSRHLFSGVRIYPDGRLQAGVDGPAFTARGHPYIHKATQRILTLYPQIEKIEWESYWSGWLAVTMDQIPHLHDLGNGAWAALGCTGRGIVHSVIQGKELASAIYGTPSSELAIEVTPVKPALSSRLVPVLVGGLLHYYRAHDYLSGQRSKHSGLLNR